MEFIEAIAFTKYVYDYLTKMNIWVYKVFFCKTRKQARSFVGLVEFGKSAGQ
jgi:ribosomal protein S4